MGCEDVNFDSLCGLVVESSWLQIQRSRVRFPALPDFLICSGSGTGPLSLVRITEELLERKSSDSGPRKSRLTAAEIRCADHATPSILKKLALTSPTSGGHSVGIVRFRIEATEM
jgi:hypothetical protein